MSKRILIFSDIHGDLKALERLMAIEADLYIAAGDLSNFARGLDKIGPVLAPKGQQMLVMPGNHESESDVVKFTDTWGLRNFHRRVIEFAGYQIAGLGYSNITPFKTPGEYTETQIAEHLSPWSGLNPLVLVCHCPPKDTLLDRAGPGKHFGSPAVRAFIDANQPEYFFCGHIHEAEGVETIIGEKTRGRNVGKRGYLLTVPATA
jgi:Icc-related predicted phosphoesterase